MCIYMYVYMSLSLCLSLYMYTCMPTPCFMFHIYIYIYIYANIHIYIYIFLYVLIYIFYICSFCNTLTTPLVAQVVRGHKMYECKACLHWCCSCVECSCSEHLGGGPWLSTGVANCSAGGVGIRCLLALCSCCQLFRRGLLRIVPQGVLGFDAC